MSNLVPFGNYHLIDDFFRDLSNPGFFIKPLHGESLPAQIKIEVKEGKEEFTVYAELPGINKEDIDVSVDANILTITATVQQEDKQTKDEKVLRSERYYGRVTRSVSLPTEVDKSRAVAKYDKGILILTLPKQEAAMPHRLMIT